MAKTINVSLARPGTGKTTKACKVIHTWVSLGRRVLLVVPTVQLADQVCKDLAAIKPVKIDYRDEQSPVNTLNHYLDGGEELLIVCQHASFQRCDARLLYKWTVVVDELPMPVTPQPTTVRRSQFAALPFIVKGTDGKLQIEKNCVLKARELVRTGMPTQTGIGPAQLLSDDCCKIYKAILDGLDVYISTDDFNNNCVVYFSEESGIFERFDNCKEIHVLSATWQGSLFEWFANAHGYKAVPSRLTPDKPEPHLQRVTIYPMLAADQCSKTVLNGDMELTEEEKAVGGTPKRVIQVVTDKVSVAVGLGQQCLVFVQQWAALSYPQNMIKRDMDSRGLNDMTNVSNVLCMFHGNHVTTATNCLKLIAEKYGASYESLQKAWKRTFLFDATLQNVYRCSLRNSRSIEDVALYVQTYEVAEYLVDTFIENATIDMRFIETYRNFKKRGRKSNPKRDEAIGLLERGLSPAQVMEKTGLPNATVYNYSRKLRNCTLQTA
jgi:hypothetical protein